MNLKNLARRIRDEFLACLKYGPFFRLKEKKLSSNSFITAVYPGGADSRNLPTTEGGFSYPPNLNSKGGSVFVGKLRPDTLECPPSIKIASDWFYPKKSDKLCLMAHFDPHGRIEPYVSPGHTYTLTLFRETGEDVESLKLLKSLKS